MSEKEVRELGGILNPKGSSDEKIEALEILPEQYRLKVLNESNALAESFYKNVSEVAKLKAELIRIDEGLKPEHKEAINMMKKEIENNDLSRLERFKKWAKENMLGVSAISIAGVNHCRYGMRKAIVQGAKATSKFAKAVEHLAKKVGPLLGPLLNLLTTAIGWGAKGLSWFAGNLWILAIAAAWFIYDQYKQNKKNIW